MTWQLGAFSVLALALVAGFGWYERDQPDARIVALVGTLAAFAALGRIAFAATPNVKPTTDIVLISGLALGAGPGFVVGAIAALTSNFFFGQGPWTPWQMVGWGVTGLIGAGIARIAADRGTGRPTLPRWPLALVCAVVGFAFTAFQDFGDWITYSDHSLVQLRVYVGKGIGFDFLHAAGCLGFALAFGPALVRALGRLRARLDVSWRPAEANPALLSLVVAATLATGLAGAPPARANVTPATYLLQAQRHDGGFGASPGDASMSLFTGWAALGLAALGHNPADVRLGGASALDYTRAGVSAISDAGALERTILVVAGAGASVRDFGGHDLQGALARDVRRDGSVAEQVNLTAFAVLAFRAVGVAPPSKMLGWLVRQEDSDGGFNFATAGGTSDVDDTGAALEALAGVGGRSAEHARARAVRFIRSQQAPDGGFPSNPGGESNAQSSSWAVQGLIAAGVDLNTLHHGSPLRYIRSLVQPDGHVRYSRSTDQTPVWVTGEAALALAGKPLPLAAVARSRSAHRAPARATSPAPRSPRAAAKRTRPAGARTPGADRRNALLGLAAEAGIVTAIVLAPVGLG